MGKDEDTEEEPEEKVKGEVWSVGEIATQTSPVLINNKDSKKTIAAADPIATLVQSQARVLNYLEDLKKLL